MTILPFHPMRSSPSKPWQLCSVSTLLFSSQSNRNYSSYIQHKGDSSETQKVMPSSSNGAKETFDFPPWVWISLRSKNLDLYHLPFDFSSDMKLLLKFFLCCSIRERESLPFPILLICFFIIILVELETSITLFWDSFSPFFSLSLPLWIPVPWSWSCDSK